MWEDIYSETEVMGAGDSISSPPVPVTTQKFSYCISFYMESSGHQDSLKGYISPKETPKMFCFYIHIFGWWQTWAYSYIFTLPLFFLQMC